MSPPIYMDYQATTPMDPAVVEAMLPYMREHFGNPHSGGHSYGWKAEAAIDVAREQIADVIGAMPEEILFTSGATEANNMIIRGLSEIYGQRKNHIITVVSEHKCVLESCRYVSRHGMVVEYLPIDRHGLIDLDLLKRKITPNTLLVSVMAANNEIGVLQPLEAIGELCKAYEIFFHSDAAQAFGKVPLSVDHMHMDVMSLSGHKIYGPKGIGALYLRSRPRVRLAPLLYGGGQEQGLRPGTVPTPLAVGFGKAALIASGRMVKDDKHVRRLSDLFYQLLSQRLDDIRLNGDAKMRLPGNVNITFGGITSSSLLVAIKELAVSSGAACASASLEPSYVLKALGLQEDAIGGAIRFGIGRFSTEEEIRRAAQVVVEAVCRLR